MERIEVELSYVCEHSELIKSPGVHDPAGVYQDELTPSLDGKFRVELSGKCYECRK